MYCRGVPAFHDFEADRVRKNDFSLHFYIHATRAEVAEL